MLTTSVVGTGQPQTVYGQVKDIYGWAKEGQLISLAVDASSALLAQTDSQGYWQTNLGNLKQATGQPFLSTSGQDLQLSPARNGEAKNGSLCASA